MAFHTTIIETKFTMTDSEQKKDTVSQVSSQSSSLSESPKKKSFVREFVEFALIALLIVVPFRIYIAQPFIVNGLSMDPTFKNGEYLIVDQLSYRFKTPERGSVIIFKYPLDTSKYFIKRVIGLPGETVLIKKGVVTIKNSAHPNGFTLDEPYIKLPKQDDFTTTLDSGNYFVMGDNRFGSADSRLWGSLPSSDIIGRPVVRLFPLTHVGTMPGDETAQLKASEK
jgi:signal peptidase I